MLVGIAPRLLELVFELLNLLLELVALAALVLKIFLQLALSALELGLEARNFDLESLRLLLFLLKLVLQPFDGLFCFLQFLLQTGQVFLKVTSRHAVLLNHLVQPVDLSLKALDHAISIGDGVLAIRDHSLLVKYLLIKSLELEVSIGKLALELTQFIDKLFFMLFQDLLRPRLLLIAGLLDGIVEFFLPLFDEVALLGLSLLPQRVLTVQLFRQQVIILFIVLLDVRCDFFSVGFFERINSLVVGLELVELLFVFLHASVESSFDLGDLALEIGHF